MHKRIAALSALLIELAPIPWVLTARWIGLDQSFLEGSD
jgi:hypothetical protein